MTRRGYLQISSEKLRDAVPDIAISTDIIVGFPGETEKDFEDTLDLAERVGYDSAFTLSVFHKGGYPGGKIAGSDTGGNQASAF